MTTTGGVYAREKDNWEGACGHFILALRACVNFQGKTPSGYVNSFGPDYGTVCDIYALPDCVGMHIAGVAYPGLTEYTEHDDAGEKGGRSYVCYV
ncbi:hypothetical protein MMC19_002049 [Ptychographa xylographoides]|nr:hypothetical protein [Ptychographa xylographoides]